MTDNNQSPYGSLEVIGELNAEEMQKLQNFRREANQMTLRVGSLEIQKARLIGEQDAIFRSLESLEAESHKVLAGIGTRLGIADDQYWQVTPDGKAVIVPQPANSKLGQVVSDAARQSSEDGPPEES